MSLHAQLSHVPRDLERQHHTGGTFQHSLILEQECRTLRVSCSLEASSRLCAAGGMSFHGTTACEKRHPCPEMLI